MCCSIFMDDYFFFRQPFDFYYYYLIYLAFIVYVVFSTKSTKLLPKWFLRFMLLLYTLSLLVSWAYGTMGFHLVKQFLGITYSAIAFFLLLKANNFDIKYIFGKYTLIAFFVALWGLMTEFLMLAGINVTDKVKETTMGFYRIYSIMGEPYFLAVALIPALYYHVFKFVSEKSFRTTTNTFKTSVIFICYLFTFSSAGFIGLALMIVMYLWSANYFSVVKGKAKLLLLPIFFILAPIFYNSLRDALYEFQVRIDDTLDVFQGGEPDIKAISEVNSSTFALYTNFVIAQESFVRNPFFGSGLGSHPVNYDITFEKYFPPDFIVRFGTFNKFDANSLFLRLMSETGLFGLSAIFIFLFKFFMRKKYLSHPDYRDYNIINQGIFILIIVRLIRTGSYFGNGFFLFIFLYYYTKRIAEGRFRIPGVTQPKPPAQVATVPASSVQPPAAS
jgi:hypothetical protein